MKDPLTPGRRAKIVATLGPASSDLDTIQRLIEAGVDVARINFSHGDPASWQRLVYTVRAAQEIVGKPVAIVGDLQGPKIRIGEVPQPFEVVRNERLTIVAGSNRPAGRDEGHYAVACPYGALIDEVGPGEHIYLRDGEIELRVEAVNGDRIETLVRGGGRITSRAGLHAQGAGAQLDAVTDVDRVNARFAVQHGMDFVALSFVRTVDDVLAGRAAIEDAGGALPMIAKIETAVALDSLDEIIGAADAAMVARGDLGVEVGAAEVPVLQRTIIEAAGQSLAPVIIATQMLESMVERARPTRAEASDVANAVWDGADALMLSAETAVGRWPVETVEMMAAIIRTAEANDHARWVEPDHESWAGDIGRTIAWAVGAAVEQHSDVRAVIGFTVSGRSGRLIAKERLPVPTLVLAPTSEVQQRMQLFWGISPALSAPPGNLEDMLTDVERTAVRELGLEAGDRIIVTGGFPIGHGEPTNFLKLHNIPASYHEGMSSHESRDILVYVTQWCGDSRRAVRFLDEHKVPYRSIDIDEDDAASEVVKQLNRGNRSTPTILIDGVHVATEPSRDEMAGLFGVELPPDEPSRRAPDWLRRRNR